MPDLSLSGLNILLVEPSAMQTQLVQRMLAQLGVPQLHHFDHAGAALAEMYKLQPDAVISSLYLPDMQGTELVTAMRNDPRLEWVPFILISSETRPQVLDPVRQSGACCIIAKPFTTEQLTRALRAVIDHLDFHEQLDIPEIEELKVLLVDDSPFSRRFVRHQIEEMGIENIIEAANGKDAVQILADTIVDLVITDYNMPEMDGRALIEYIRTRSWQTDVPILMITSENNQSRLAAVEKAGVSAICDKPFESGGGLRELIARALHR
jgi:two-component system chemotaxis response regulator CheY